jgi:type VI secretion system secreted protein VgrG
MTARVTGDPFALECKAVSDRIRVRAFYGDEALGRTFDYQIFFTIAGDEALELAPEGVVGATAVLTIGDKARVEGRVAEIELLDLPHEASYRLRLVPDLWFLRHSLHSRVFVDKTFPEILELVLKAAAVAANSYELRLTGTYPKREHVCQYQESDLDFIQRWLEREGIHYFFDHGAAGSKLCFVDSPSAHSELRATPVAYHPFGSTDASSTDAFTSFRKVTSARPKHVTTSDYNYLTPATVIAETEAIAPELTASVTQWAENELDSAGAKAASRVRAERDKCEKARYLARGAALSIHAGFTFTLDRHPLAELNRSYLAVRARIAGQMVDQTGRGFAHEHPELNAQLGNLHRRDDSSPSTRDVQCVEVEAIAADVPFRLARTTPWPRANGLELARVDGPIDDDYAQLDEHGRYLVRLMMDENDSPSGKASTRVRQLQPHAGAPEGCHFPLRKGTEVLIAFVGGDPDRPVIAGAMPNAHDPSPVTSANHTQNVLVTGGLSRFEMEDQDGSQYVDVSTPPQNTFFHFGAHAGLGDHNIVMSTDGDGLVRTGGNRDVTIGGDQNEDVQQNLTEDYHANQTTHVAGAFSETIDAGSTQTIHAGLTQSITGGLQQTIDGGETRTVSGGVTETITGSRTQTITGSSAETVSAAQTQTISGAATITTSAKYTVKAAGGINLTSSGPINMLASSWTLNAPGGQTNLDDFFLSIASKNCKTYQVLFQPSIASIAIGVIEIGFIGYRRDEFTKKLEASGVVIQNSSVFKTDSMAHFTLISLFGHFGFLGLF